MKRPAFQFYTADWRNNAKLRRCSPAARGVWMDVLCVLHDSDEYGVCRWPLADLANAAGAPLKLVRELVEKDVLKGADQGCAPYVYTPRHAGKDGEPVALVASSEAPCWYSSRFVRDEWVRARRGSETRFEPPNGQPIATPVVAPKPPIGEPEGDGSTSSSSSSSSKQEKAPAALVVGLELIPQDLLDDWTGVRAAKRAGKITPTVVKALEREASKAGLSVEDAIRKCVERAWVGFEADWLKDAKAKAADVARSTVPAKPADSADAYLAEEAAHRAIVESQRLARRQAA